MSGCEDLLSVCRCCLRGVAWFSYWFHNLGFITEGNTYRCCAASSLPLWGNTDVASRGSKKDLWRRCRGGLRTGQDIPSTHHKLFSLALHYLSFTSRFPLPHFTFAVLFSLFRSLLVCLCVGLIACHDGSR